MNVVLKQEADPSSRTGSAFRAYYHANGAPLQSLHIAGETEQEAAARVKQAYPGAIVETASSGSDCSCKHAATSSAPLKSMAGVAMAGETLMAVYEGDDEAVYGCGECPCQGAGAPSAVRMERAVKGPQGAYSFQTTGEAALPADLYKDCASGPGCLPWVRVQRDPEHFKKCLAAARKFGPIRSSKDFYHLVKKHMIREDQEVFYVLLLDVHSQILGITELARGARDRVLTPVPDVIRLPLVEGATGFAVAHNHPSGKVRPSDADKEVTKAIKQAADATGILFMDHIIVGADGYYSFLDAGQLKN